MRGSDHVRRAVTSLAVNTTRWPVAGDMDERCASIMPMHSVRPPSSPGVEDVRRQRYPIAGEDEPEEAGDADRVSP
jgi:hypothetical protein